MIGNDWDIILEEIFEDDKFKKMLKKLEAERKKKVIYPEKDDVFNAFKLTPFKDVRAVIIGQDPYHGEGEAHGLAFSVRENKIFPPSLRNIFKELESDLNIKNETTELTKWAKQGILMINTILTVEKDKPLSHKNLGWQEMTNYVIKKLSDSDRKIIFILWGNNAKLLKKYIDEENNYIIESSHPSFFSANRGFFGSRPFSKINTILKDNQDKQIDFKL